ncbi:MAG: hypothetical protein IAE80_21070 [Anaerolinea sp.]|nr:hypothetical protein [Anaerolinea sp.]
MTRSCTPEEMLLRVLRVAETVLKTEVLESQRPPQPVERPLDSSATAQEHGQEKSV